MLMVNYPEEACADGVSTEVPDDEDVEVDDDDSDLGELKFCSDTCTDFAWMTDEH